MSTFLELCRDVHRESGHSGENLPASVTGQVGVLAKIVHWVREAWNEIQADYPQMRCLWYQPTGAVLAGKNAYTLPDLGISAGSKLVPETSTLDDEDINQMDWRDFRALKYHKPDAAHVGQPHSFAIAPNNQVYLYPVPDKAYSFECEAFRARQVLSNGTDVPLLPEELRNAIKWRALMWLAEDEEDQAILNKAARGYENTLANIVSDQLPDIKWGEHAFS